MSIKEYKAVSQDDTSLEAELRTPIKTNSHWHRLGSSPKSQAGAALLLLLLGAILGALILSHSQAEKPDDLMSLLANVPFKETEFSKSEEYFRTDQIGDQAWNDLMPNGGGYLHVPYPRKHNLPPSRALNDSEQSEVYQASVVHQLHCLAVLRETVMAYQRGGALVDIGGALNYPHCYHCLDILRQAVLCTADVTLIFGTRRKGGSSTYLFDGVGSVHKCRDWEATKEILVQHRSKDYTGPLIGT